MLIRPARIEDAPGMARVMVDTFMAAHKGHMPDEAWARHRDAWSYEDSARAWEKTLRMIGNDANTRECVYVACDPMEEIIGLAMGQPVEALDNTGEVNCLYVRQDHQGRGVGRRLVQAVAADLARNGMSALHIAVLAANAPARRFYEVLGGRVIAGREFEEYGFMLPGVVYGWPDIRTLIPRNTLAGPTD